MRVLLSLVVVAVFVAGAAASDSGEDDVDTCLNGLAKMFSPTDNRASCLGCGAALRFSGGPGVSCTDNTSENAGNLAGYCSPEKDSDKLCPPTPRYMMKNRNTWACQLVTAGSDMWESMPEFEFTLKEEFSGLLDKKSETATNAKREECMNYFEENWDSLLLKIAYGCFSCSSCCPKPKPGEGSLALGSEAFYAGYQDQINGMPAEVKDTLDAICLDRDIGKRAKETSDKEKSMLEEAERKKAEAEQAKREEEERVKQEQAEIERLERERQRIEEEERRKAEEAETQRLEMEAKLKKAQAAERARLEREAAEEAKRKEAERQEFERKKAEIAERERQLEEEKQRKAEEEKRNKLKRRGIELPGEREEDKTLDKLPANVPVPIPKDNPVINLIKIPVGLDGNYVLILRPTEGKHSNVKFTPRTGTDMRDATNVLSRAYRSHNMAYLSNVINAMSGMMEHDESLQCMAVGHTAAIRPSRSHRDAASDVHDAVSAREDWCHNARLQRAVARMNDEAYLTALSEGRARQVSAYLAENGLGGVRYLGLGASHPSESAYRADPFFPQSMGEKCRRVEIVCGRKVDGFSADIVSQASDVCNK